MKNFSYKDISRLAKVSISTISRFYNGGYVGKNTKAKIQAVVKEHDFYPNHGARVVRGRDSSIFIIVPEWYENSYTHIMQGVEQAAKNHNRKVVITHASPNPEEYIETIRYAASWKPGAIIFLLPQDDENIITNYIQNNIKDSVPIIYGKEAQGISWVKIDYEFAFYSVTKKFFEFIEPGEKVLYLEDAKLSKEQKENRFAGFEKACQENNVVYDKYLLKNKDIREIYKFLNILRRENIVNVVCSTHEVFISMISSGDKNLRLTDIGWLSIYDYQNKYKTKIFIDYPEIGINMERILFKIMAGIEVPTADSRLIKPRII